MKIFVPGLGSWSVPGLGSWSSEQNAQEKTIKLSQEETRVPETSLYPVTGGACYVKM